MVLFLLFQLLVRVVMISRVGRLFDLVLLDLVLPVPQPQELLQGEGGAFLHLTVDDLVGELAEVEDLGQAAALPRQVA